MLYLIRHGETAENAARVMQLPHVPLSERGAQQARALAARLANEGIEHILASDLRRAAMTAEILAEATGAKLEPTPLLHERNFGALRGTRYEDLDCNPFEPGYVPPEGESEEAFFARCEQAWQRVEALANSARRFAVVTHGLVCRAFVERHIGLAPGLEPPVGWGNTALTIADPGPPWTVTLLACTAHLEPSYRPGAAA